MRFGMVEKAFSIAVMVVAMGVTAASARTIYECQLPEIKSNLGWLPTVVVVAVDAGSDKVLVSDPMIEAVRGGPIEVVPDVNNDKRLTLSWDLSSEAVDQIDVHMTYDLTILKGQKTAKMSGMPHGFDNWFSSTGTCKVSK